VILLGLILLVVAGMLLVGHRKPATAVGSQAASGVLLLMIGDRRRRVDAGQLDVVIRPPVIGTFIASVPARLG
jgi:hypothetical protein